MRACGDADTCRHALNTNDEGLLLKKVQVLSTADESYRLIVFAAYFFQVELSLFITLSLSSFHTKT